MQMVDGRLIPKKDKNKQQLRTRGQQMQQAGLCFLEELILE